MRAIRSIAVLLGLSLLISCSGGADRAAENTLHRGLQVGPETLDPHRSRSTEAGEILRDLGEGLVGYSPAAELVPAAAERWDVSEDGLIWTFHLRDGLRWSNGDALPAGHFVAGMRRLVDPATAAFYADKLIDVENAAAIVAGELSPEELGVEAPDDRTLVVRLERPIPYLLKLLTHASTFPVHPPSLAEHGDSFARPGRFVSNGAYRLVDWVPAALLSLERNEYYWDNDTTAIDAVNYHVLVMSNAELSRYRAGDLHITASVPPDAFQMVREEYGDQLHVAPRLGVYFYGFNLARPPFADNLALREALSMAVDREQLVASVTGRGEQPAWSWVPPGVDNYTPPRLGFAALSKDERERLARLRYKEAGYGPDKPLQIELRYNTGDQHKKIAVAVQSMWRDVLGVEATLVNEEFGVLLSNIRAAEITQVFRSGWTGDYNDAHTFLDVMMGGNASNLTGYASEEYDQLMRRAAAQVDPDRRRLYMEEAERVMLSDHPLIPLYVYVNKHLIRPEVVGWEDNVLDYHYSRHLSLE
ncbi:MAG: peptide ABC transporter substrate-binding protein [Gammaproteobacteria bacterium]|nr:peptide ABC transporter substrate-binding protein [Gammaproteobacteria bacterium]